MALDMPLKLKYRVYRFFSFGTYKARTGNSHPPRPSYNPSRRRAYGPVWTGASELRKPSSK